MKLGFGTQKTIVLVGMMGVGKTSAGRRLARRMGSPFSDTDHEVELAAGHTISDIYEYYGEKAFRDAEKRVMKRLLSGTPHVISTGVGTFADPETRQWIKDQAISVWLYANIDSILPRITPRSHRPQLLQKEEGTRETLERLIEEYYPIYQEADIRVECMHRDTNDTVESIIEALAFYSDKGLNIDPPTPVGKRMNGG